MLLIFYLIKRSAKTWTLLDVYNHIIKTQASNADRVLIESAVTNLMRENLIINQKSVSGFNPFRSNAPLNEETMPNVIMDKSQDKNEMIIDESVTPCQPTP